jgi:hypothetical protein
MLGNSARRAASRLCAAGLGVFVFAAASLAAEPPPLGKPEIMYAHAAWSSGRLLYASCARLP